MKQECLSDLKLYQKTPIVYFIQSDMVWEGDELTRNLLCMQIFVIMAEASSKPTV